MTDFDYENAGDAEHWQPSDYQPAVYSVPGIIRTPDGWTDIRITENVLESK